MQSRSTTEKTLKTASRRKRRPLSKSSKKSTTTPIWKNLYARIDELIGSLPVKKPRGEKELSKPVTEKEVEVTIDNKHYGRCPMCSMPFNYDSSDLGRLVRCRSCSLPMRLKGEEVES